MFKEIQAKVQSYLKTHPGSPLIYLGIGDTTEPLPKVVANSLAIAAEKMGTKEGYTGYGDEQGKKELREAIAKEFYLNKVHPDDIFISDGTKCDIGRLQLLFGTEAKIAVQNPTYPAYVDTSLLSGKNTPISLPVHPNNQFFPDLFLAKEADIIYFCSPNNPTGAIATHSQLEKLVSFAIKEKKIILFDAAYAAFIQDPTLPKSIFEIEGASTCAIEMGSFSKMIGFTGVRLGWTVVPSTLTYTNKELVKTDWKRIHSTFFNGASNIVQSGAVAAFSKEGKEKTKELVQFYLNNSKSLIHALKKLQTEIFGGIHAPYLWVRFPGKTSLQAFDLLLEKAQIVTTPGNGFGSEGEGFIRISAFASQQAIKQASDRLNRLAL